MTTKENNKTKLSGNVRVLTREEQMAKLEGTYEEFILWFALPRHEKINMGIETQEAFAEYHGLNDRTLRRWKSRFEFFPKVNDFRRAWAKERTSDVIASIYRSSISGGREAPQAQKLWMQLFEGFTENGEQKMGDKVVEIGVNDIRFLIEQLPDEYKQKHYANLRELLDDAQHLRHHGLLENRDRSKGPTDDVPDIADNDAQDVPGEAADVVPDSNQESIRTDMVREVQPYNNKSAARWREKQTLGDDWF